MSQDIVFTNDRPASSLIELYSSEGCSSCPPAEAWINHLKEAPRLWKDLFPVAFHVDYWDGLGWPDRFARADYTQRQRHYAEQLAQDSVYTPEFVVNGLEWKQSWLSPRTLPSACAAKTGKLSLTLREKDKALSALYVPEASRSNQPLTLNVAWLGFDLISNVKRGENGGRTLTHDFVVLDFQSTPLTTKADSGFQSGPLKMASSTSDAPGAVVAWVSKDDGAVLQVAGGWISSSESGAK